MAQIAIMAGLAAASFAIDYFAVKKSKVAPIDRGRCDDLRVQGSDYGAAIPVVLGKIRLAGQIVWNEPVRHTVTTTPGTSGGKGAPQPPTPAVNNHHYFTSLMMLLAAGPAAYGVLRIWENSKLIYDISPNPIGPITDSNLVEAESGTLAGTAAISADTNASSGSKVTGLGGTGTATYTLTDIEAGQYWLNIVYFAPSGAKTLNLSINGGAAVAISFPQTTGTFSATEMKAVAVTLAAGANTLLFSYTTSATPDLDYFTFYPKFEINTPPVTGIPDPVFGNFPANLDAPYPFYDTNPAAPVSGQVSAVMTNGTIRTYLGTSTQQVDSTISAILGATKTQAFRNRVCMMVDDAEIPEGRVPNYTAELDEGTRTVADAVTKLFALVNLPAAKLDVTGLTSLRFGGLVINQRSEVKQMLDHLQLAYNFDFVEVGGVIKAVVRSTALAATIPQDDLRAYSKGEQPPSSALQITRLEERSLPRSVEIDYLDPALDYHNNTQEAHRLTGKTEDNEKITLPLVLTKDEAAAIAARVLYIRHTERMQFEWQTSFKWLELAPTDVVDIVTDTATYRVRITDMQAQLPVGLIKFKGVAVDAPVYTQNPQGRIGSGFERPPIATPPNLLFGVADVPPLRLQEGEELGRYMGIAARTGGYFTGGFIFREVLAGQYGLLTTLDKEATMGVTLSTLANVTDTSVLDRTSTVDIGLYSGTFSSVSESDLLDSPETNAIVIGSEPMQFAVATPLTVAAGEPYIAKYRLSVLARARRGTEWATSTHATGESAMLLDSSVIWVKEQPEEIGRTRNFKAVSSGQQLETVLASALPFYGYSLKPLASVNLTGTRDAIGNLLIDWTGRTRLARGLRDRAGAPRDETEERYELEVYNGATLTRPAAGAATLTLNKNSIQQVLWTEKGSTAASYPFLNGKYTAGFTISSDGTVLGVPDSTATPKTGWIRSAQVIYDGDFDFEFTVGSGEAMPQYIGLERYSLSNQEPSLSTMDYYFRAADSGGYHSYAETFDIGLGISPGRYRITRRNGIVRYYLDYNDDLSTPLYTSSKASDGAYRLVVYLAGGTNSFAGYARKPLLRYDASSYVYTAAQQVADFGSTQSAVSVKVYSVSPLTGRGSALTGTI